MDTAIYTLKMEANAEDHPTSNHERVQIFISYLRIK